MTYLGRLRVAFIVGACASFNLAAASEFDLSQAARLYISGCGLSAISLLEHQIGSSPFTENPTQRFAAYRLLFDVCSDTYDWQCFNVHLPGFVDTARELGDPSELAWASYYWAVLKRLVGDPKEPTAATIFEQLTSVADPVDVELWISCQVRAAESELAAGKAALARGRADRALWMALSLRKPGPYLLTKWLLEICSVMAGCGDLIRASQVLVHLEPLARQAIPVDGYLQLHYRILVAAIAERLGGFALAEASFRHALATSGGTEGSEWSRRSLRDGWTLALAGILLADGKIQEADDALAGYSRSDVLLRSGTGMQSFTDLDYDFVAAVTLVRLSQKSEMPANWLAPLLKTAGKADPNSTSIHELHKLSMVLGATALQHLQTRTPGVDAQIKEFIQIRIRMHQLMAERIPDVTALPNATDRVFLRLALDLLGTDPRSRESVDLALQVGQIVNRTARDADADVLALLANGENDNARRNAHALMRLSGQERIQELDALDALVEALTHGREPSGDARFPIYDETRRNRFDELGRHRDYLRESVFEKLGASAVSQVPTLTELQTALKEDEVLVLFFPNGEYGIHVVVYRDDAFVKVTKTNWFQTMNDVRLILLALTATHPASEALDSQYPVQAARRLYDGLLRPALGQRSSRHVVWVPPERLSPLPISALLEQEPPAEGDGYNLAGARFLVSDHDVSVVTSVKEFVAARQLALRAKPITSFFGAGDPVSIGPSQSTGDSVPVPPSWNTFQVADRLPAIPEASTELLDISQLFEGSAVTLTRVDATEANVRRRLLGSVSLIDFATHGLFNSDPEAASSAALVLSPGDSRSAADDGLLTATEIADFTLHARLAILAACNTGLANESWLARSVQGLTTALALAGVPASLVTLWSVNSDLSRKLMTETVLGLRERGQGPAASLSDAIRRHLASPGRAAYLHPRFWAPFVIYGDGGNTSGPLPDASWGLERFSILNNDEPGSLVSVTGAFGGPGVAVAGVLRPSSEDVGTVALVCPDGRTSWMNRYPRWYPVKLTATPEGLLSVGILVSADTGEESVVARRFDEHGNEMWNTTVDASRRQAVIVATFPDGKDWRVLLSVADSRAEIAKRKLLAISFDDHGQLCGTTETELQDGNGALPGLVISRTSSVKVALRSWQQADPARRDVTGGDRPPSPDCEFTPMTTLGEVHGPGSSWEELHRFPYDLIADSILDATGRLVLAGSKVVPCAHLEGPVLHAFEPISRRWSESLLEQALPGRIKRLFLRHSDGALIAIGSTERIGDVTPDDEAFGDELLIPGLEPEEPLRGRHWEDAVIYGVDMNDSLRPVTWLEAGSPVHLRDASLSGDDILTLVGSVGDRAFIARYTWIARASQSE